MQRDRGAYYRPELDVLRFFAFLLVYVHHALLFASPYRVFDVGTAKVVASLIIAGGLGVDLFFVLSAFLITKLLLIEQRTTGAIHVPSFLVRRALRIWPLYFAFLLASVYLIPHLLPQEHLGRQFVWFLLFLGNWACALFGYPPSVAAPLWSVSVEEQFYLVWPLLLVALGTRRIAVAACILLVVAFCTRVLLWAHGAVHPAIWANTLARLDPIAIGILLAWLSEKDRFKLTRRQQLLLMIVGALVPPAAMVILGGGAALTGDGALALYPVVALGWGLLVFGLVFGPRSTAGWVHNAALIHLGRISYGLYVFHLFAIDLVARYAGLWRIEGEWARAWAEGALALPLTIALAMASYRFLERPFLTLKQRFTFVRSAPVDDVSARDQVKRRVEFGR